MQFLFPDINVSYFVTEMGGIVPDFREGTVNKLEVILSMDSETFLAIHNHELAGATALGQGRITITGIVGGLLFLEKHPI